MNSPNPAEGDQALRAELREARERVVSLVEDLRAVDVELDAIEAERSHYELVDQACTALEALEEAGAGGLFWESTNESIDVAAGIARGDAHLRGVRARFEAFRKQFQEIEDRRQLLLEEIEIRQADADGIAGEVLDAERLAEQMESEWLVEREVDDLPVPVSVMPWSSLGDEDRRLRKALAISLFLSLLIGLLLPLVDLPVPERWKVLEEQERLTQLIPQERPKPPPVVVPETKPVVPDEPVETQEPVPTEEPIVAETPVPESAPAAAPADTASTGILAFREQFSSLAKADAVDRLGSNARLEAGGDTSAGLPERSMVTSQAAGSSGGINVAALSRSGGGTGKSLGGVAVSKATSTIGGNGGGGSGRQLAGGGPGIGRTDEEIQIVFDRHKAALYRYYNRALRQNPTLRGQIVLRLTIEPDGSVSMCEVKSTDMNAPELAAKVVERVSTFDFGAKEAVPAITITYPIDFLPAT